MGVWIDELTSEVTTIAEEPRPTTTPATATDHASAERLRIALERQREITARTATEGGA